MTKSTRIVKRLIALSLVLLLSIDSFAAVVGDNDGAVFITKAEFDSMKNDFQSQLDRYNSSIDNKIDGAIAAYLAGVTVGTKQELKALVTNYDEMKWMNSLKVYGQYVRYTSPTNKEHESTGNEWFTPHLGERRATLTLRGGNIWIWDALNSNNYTTGNMVMRAEVDDWDGITQCPAWTMQFDNTEADACFPISLVKIKANAIDSYEIEASPFAQTEGASNVLETLPHTVPGTGGSTYDDWWSNKGIEEISNLNFYDVSEGEYLKWSSDIKYIPYNMLQ